MIWLRNATLGETQAVASAEVAAQQGYAAPDWVEVAARPGERCDFDDGSGTWVAWPPAPMMPEQIWQLLTVPEHVAARAAGDATVSVCIDLINAARAPLPINSAALVALVTRLVTPLAVLTEARATRILAGLLPE